MMTGRITLLLLFLLTATPGKLCAQKKGSGTYSIQTRTRKVTGSPLVWDTEKLFLLTGYGCFTEVRFKDVQAFTKRSESRIVFSRSSFEKKLKSEFGVHYQVSLTQDYLVVHPVGQDRFWPNRIQSVYTSFENYFRGRRIPLGKHDYPLVALVFATRAEFDEYSRKNGEKIDRNIVGYYSPNTNRIVMYDQSQNGGTWTRNLDTVVHEISHQAAFNCGLHGRFADTPRWVVEGLGTMFEAPGVWDSLNHPQQVERVNKGLLGLFREKTVSRNVKGWIGDVVVGNRLFEKDPEVSYSSSWALSFYLMETQPRKYVDYMKMLEGLPPFKKYPAEKRVSDFSQAFGDFDRLEGLVRNFFTRFE